MEAWLELGLLIHVVLGIFAGTAVLLTALAIFRFPKADPGTAGRPSAPSRAGEPRMRPAAPATANS